MKTKQSLIEQVENLTRDNTAQMIALNAILNKEETFSVRKGDYTLRIYRPSHSHGGVVVVTFAPRDNPQQAPYSSSFFWEEWYRETCANYDYTQSEAAYKLREAAFIIHRWVTEKQKIAA